MAPTGLTAGCQFAPWADPAAKAPDTSFESVTKRFGSFAAIDDLEPQLFIEREFFALLGPVRLRQNHH